MPDKKFVPVMITPFNLKAKVDLDVVSTLIDFYLAAGVKGFFANCLSSEMYSISEDERRNSRMPRLFKRRMYRAPRDGKRVRVRDDRSCAVPELVAEDLWR